MVLLVANTLYAEQVLVERAYSKIILRVPDSVMLEESFFVYVEFVDNAGRRVTEVEDFSVTVSANKENIVLSRNNLRMENIALAQSDQRMENTVLAQNDVRIHNGTGFFYATSSSWTGEGLVFSITDGDQLNATSDSITVLPYTPAEKKKVEVADLAQQPLTGLRVEKQSQGYRDLHQLTRERAYLIREKELYEEYHAVFPQDRRFLYSLAKAVERIDQDSSKAIALYEECVAELAKQPLTWSRVEQQSQGYRDLHRLTGDRTYLISEKELYEESHAAFPQDLRFLCSLAGMVDGIDQNSSKAIALYRECGEYARWVERLDIVYRTVMQVEFCHPGTMSTDELDEFFQAWAADIDTLKISTGTEPGSRFTEDRQSLLNRASADYYLWQADVELARSGDVDRAHRWLSEVQAINPPGDSENENRSYNETHHFNTYIHPRAELRLGDIATKRNDPQAAQQHYRTARDLLAPYVRDWSHYSYVNSVLLELVVLDQEIKGKID